jgi:hypothetical protein
MPSRRRLGQIRNARDVARQFESGRGVSGGGKAAERGRIATHFLQAFPNLGYFCPSFSKQSFGGFVGFQWVARVSTERVRFQTFPRRRLPFGRVIGANAPYSAASRSVGNERNLRCWGPGESARVQEHVLTERSFTIAEILIIGNRMSIQLRAQSALSRRDRRRSPQLGIAAGIHIAGLHDGMGRTFAGPEEAGTTMCVRFTQNYTWEEVTRSPTCSARHAVCARAITYVFLVARASRTHSRADRPKSTQRGRSAGGR